ncbi:2-dehydro-3-deoxygluconokinase [Arthrobacter subterraneus]|uniref:2-dehydro-3-deoxygluconokinase n=1 Tax=Arthrobacter subterraneus TaxID=335973 RepID=A0A1G8K8Q7_9MICC|nr:sugar kinase [Arthrobacter subterraneus]SDI39835.1 2-dehydro-3-deoxygluconokinase [Arthrobacter subterraneus]
MIPDGGADRALGVITLGETMALLKTEGVGPLSHARSLTMGIGGAESNVAIALKRLGVPTAWIGRIGNDSFGQLIERELRAEGLSVLAVLDESAPTGIMVKERRTPGTIRVAYYRNDSAGSRLCRDDIPADLFPQARLLHLTGITPALSASAADAVQYAIDCARSANVAVSFDLNYRSSLWSADTARSAYLALISQSDIVFAGDDEAAIAVERNDDPLLLAERIVQLGPSQAVIKLGAAGCAALVDGERHHQPAIPVQAVDTVGAGDAFVAGYLSELLAGENVPQRLLTAVRAGAFACLVPGDWEGMPHRSELPLLEATEPVIR